MPAAYAHERFGDEVLKLLSGECADRIRAHMDLFYVGVQGPDAFFYYHPILGGRVHEVGRAVHHASGADFFRRALRVVGAEEEEERVRMREAGEDSGLFHWRKMRQDLDFSGWGAGELHEAQRVYLAGMMCHFMLDASCHPYVNAYTAPPDRAHSSLEGEFDRMLMVRDGKDPVKTDQIPRYQVTDRIAMITEVFFGTEGTSEGGESEGSGPDRKEISGTDDYVTTKTMKSVMDSYVFLHKVFHCETDIKRQGVFLALRLIGKYEKVRGHVIMKDADPDYERGCEELLALFEAAVPETARLIGKLFAAKDAEDKERLLTEEVLQKNFLGEDPDYPHDFQKAWNIRGSEEG